MTAPAYHHALVHLDTEPAAGVSLALSLFLSNPFTGEGRAALHVHAYEGGRRAFEFVRSLGRLDDAVADLPPLTLQRGPLAGESLRAEGRGAFCAVERDGRTRRITAGGAGFALDLELEATVSSIDLGPDRPLAFAIADGYTSYAIDVPMATTRGTLETTEGRWAIEGRGYLDAQWGSAHYCSAIASWEWYRVDLPDQRLYLVSDRLHDGTARRVALIAGDDGLRVSDRLRRDPSSDGSRVIDLVDDLAVTATIGPALQDDDLAELSEGRVRRFTRHALDVDVRRDGASIGRCQSRMGRFVFGAPPTSGR